MISLMIAFGIFALAVVTAVIAESGRSKVHH